MLVQAILPLLRCVLLAEGDLVHEYTAPAFRDSLLRLSFKVLLAEGDLVRAYGR